MYLRRASSSLGTRQAGGKIIRSAISEERIAGDEYWGRKPKTNDYYFRRWFFFLHPLFFIPLS